MYARPLQSLVRRSKLSFKHLNISRCPSCRSLAAISPVGPSSDKSQAELTEFVMSSPSTPQLTTDQYELETLEQSRILIPNEDEKLPQTAGKLPKGSSIIETVDSKIDQTHAIYRMNVRKGFARKKVFRPNGNIQSTRSSYIGPSDGAGGELDAENLAQAMANVQMSYDGPPSDVSSFVNALCVLDANLNANAMRFCTKSTKLYDVLIEAGLPLHPSYFRRLLGQLWCCGKCDEVWARWERKASSHDEACQMILNFIGTSADPKFMKQNLRRFLCHYSKSSFSILKFLQNPLLQEVKPITKLQLLKSLFKISKEKTIDLGNKSSAIQDQLKHAVRKMKNETFDSSPLPLLVATEKKPINDEEVADSPGYIPLVFALSSVQNTRHIKDPYLRQTLIEAASTVGSHLKEEFVTDDSTKFLRNTRDNNLQSWLRVWTERFNVTFPEVITSLKAHEKSRSTKVSEYLTQLPPLETGWSAITDILRSFCTLNKTSRNLSVASIARVIGRSLQDELNAKILQKTLKSSPDYPKLLRQMRYSENQTIWVSNVAARRQDFRKAEESVVQAEPTVIWPVEAEVAVGAVILNHLIKIMRIQIPHTSKTEADTEVSLDDQPVLTHVYDYQQGRLRGEVRLHQSVLDIIENDRSSCILTPRLLPMVVEPAPWATPSSGGYLFHKDRNSQQTQFIKQAFQEGDLEALLTGLDILGDTPWQINSDLLQVASKAWDNHEKMPCMPQKLEPSDTDDLEDVQLKLSPRQDRFFEFQRQKNETQERWNLKGVRCTTNYKLEVAKAFLGDNIYFPHSLDFRGRAYPIPTFLNHMSDDLSRGLLLFAQRKRLGQHGLKWLKIHLANVFGYNKASFEERLAFCDNHMREIMDSANKPLEGERWWLKADDAWQCLATCFELRKALALDNPEDYESCLPVHQDGSCNGLQHYAALGKDDLGARQVNLAASDRPGDVYTYVADRASLIVDARAKDGDERAMKLQGKISRKIVKQTVMTTVYGVTLLGAKDQIYKQLVVNGICDKADKLKLSTYLAKIVMSCIGDTFQSASQIQKWLTECACLITKSVTADDLRTLFESDTPSKAFHGELAKIRTMPLSWRTPLDLPVTQPYYVQNMLVVNSPLQRISITDHGKEKIVDTYKQSMAAPPNYIHSLDGTHMLLSALNSRENNITFAAVHDSFWSHAADIDTLNKIIRETFINIHSNDLLTQLHHQFLEYSGDRLVKSYTARNALSRMEHLGESEKGHIDEDGWAELRRMSRSDRERPELAGFVSLRDILPPPPSGGSFDIKNVRSSPYFFS